MRLLAVLSFALALSGCGLGVHTETRQLGEVALSFTWQDWPLRVGEPVAVYVTLRARRAPVSGCELRLREYPSRLEVRGDEGFVAVPETRPAGVYALELEPFDESGDWVFELEADCDPLIPRQRLRFHAPVKP